MAKKTSKPEAVPIAAPEPTFDPGAPVGDVVLVETDSGAQVEAVSDDLVDYVHQTLFVQIAGQRYEHCATTADGRWVYRKS